MSAVTVLFIGGYGRSGSTLLDRILGESPGVESLGEIRHLWREGLLENRRCGCGRPFQECAHWTGVLRDVFGNPGVDADRLHALQRQVDRWWRIPAIAHGVPGGALAEYAGTLSRLYHAVARRTGAQVLVDSSKDVSHGYVLRAVTKLDPGVDVRLVHLVRDPRAVAFSWLRHKDNPGNNQPMDRWPAWRTAVEWDVINAGIAALRPLGLPYLRVRYDDLVGEPAETVRQVLRFAGQAEPQVPVSPDGTVRLSASHTAAGNPDRFRCGETTIRRDAEWRERMRRRDRLAVSVLCGLPMSRLTASR